MVLHDLKIEYLNIALYWKMSDRCAEQSFAVHFQVQNLGGVIRYVMVCNSNFVMTQNQIQKHLTSPMIYSNIMSLWNVTPSIILCADKGYRCFITCQNFQFWQVCSSDGLSVCLSVRIKVVSRIQVAPFDQSSPNLTQTCNSVRTGNPFIM